MAYRNAPRPIDDRPTAQPQQKSIVVVEVEHISRFAQRGWSAVTVGFGLAAVAMVFTEKEVAIDRRELRVALLGIAIFVALVLLVIRLYRRPTRVVVDRADARLHVTQPRVSTKKRRGVRVRDGVHPLRAVKTARVSINDHDESSLTLLPTMAGGEPFVIAFGTEPSCRVAARAINLALLDQLRSIGDAPPELRQELPREDQLLGTQSETEDEGNSANNNGLFVGFNKLTKEERSVRMERFLMGISRVESARVEKKYDNAFFELHGTIGPMTVDVDIADPVDDPHVLTVVVTIPSASARSFDEIEITRTTGSNPDRDDLTISFDPSTPLDNEVFPPRFRAQMLEVMRREHIEKISIDEERIEASGKIALLGHRDPVAHADAFVALLVEVAKCITR